MAIKINVTKKDQETLNHGLEAAGYKSQRRKFHCTVGFIEKMIPPEESTAFGEAIAHSLQELIDQEPLLYEVDKVVHLFGHVIGFVPTLPSQESLKKVNLWLFHKVHEISKGHWALNKESLPENYIPHLTLWHTRRPDRRLKKLKEFAGIHPIYHLADASYVIINNT